MDVITKEKCIICGRPTEFSVDEPIDLRDCYVKGAGQLCRACYADIYERDQKGTPDFG